MSDELGNRYRPITRALFHQHFSDDSRIVFIPEAEIPRRFKKAMDDIASENGELFLEEACIVTTRLSPLAEKSVRALARKAGYDVVIRNRSSRGRYLGSDGYGHYSTDFYEYTEYTEILVTPYQPKKGKKHAHS